MTSAKCVPARCLQSTLAWGGRGAGLANLESSRTKHKFAGLRHICGLLEARNLLLYVRPGVIDPLAGCSRLTTLNCRSGCQY